MFFCSMSKNLPLSVLLFNCILFLQKVFNNNLFLCLMEKIWNWLKMNGVVERCDPIDFSCIAKPYDLRLLLFVLRNSYSMGFQNSLFYEDVLEKLHVIYLLVKLL